MINIVEYWQETGKFPDQDEGLDILIGRPPLKEAGGALTEFDLLDFWDNKLRYEIGKDRIQITSAGADGIFNNEDDIVRQKFLTEPK